jgi:hypothetical protein
MSNPRLICFYFPQYHAFVENDKWWGRGFTDWEHVKRSKPNYKDHYQPKIPLNGNYYNPCNKETLERQIVLAKRYGIGGFMLYHYWFDGKLYLEKPLEMFLNNKDLDMPFCICWANETWTRSWVGKPEVILQEQKHTPDVSIWTKHFEYLLPFLVDTRCIRINDKPVIVIYQPSIIDKSSEMLITWRELALSNGLEGLYIIAVKNHQYLNENIISLYDGIMKFQPREAYNSKEFSKYNIVAKLQFLRLLPESIQRYFRKIHQFIFPYDKIDSKKIWEIILKNAYKNESNMKTDIFESAYFEWDNTARYGKKSKIFTGLSFEDMKGNLISLLIKAKENKSPLVFFNAWNEWAESAYLEPDEKNKYKYLEIVNDSLNNLIE